MVIGLRFKCHTLQTSRVTVSPVSRDSPLETSGRSPARAYELDTSRSPPSKGVRNHPARLSSNISQGRPSVNRAASYLSSPSPACPPVWRAPLPERPPDPSPPAAAAPLPARARPTAPRGRRRRAAPAPASRATAATRRVHARDGTPLYRSRLGKPPHGPRLLPLPRACGPLPGRQSIGCHDRRCQPAFGLSGLRPAVFVSNREAAQIASARPAPPRSSGAQPAPCRAS
mmetsp:Transcript_2381/g.7856  ORF Transcript_2381/g.7856 Transcript_2381/m.7856 type:complete len:229 (-) Transcript_2381:98-784(-)